MSVSDESVLAKTAIEKAYRERKGGRRYWFGFFIRASVPYPQNSMLPVRRTLIFAPADSLFLVACPSIRKA
jgi:hypothetical protein